MQVSVADQSKEAQAGKHDRIIDEVELRMAIIYKTSWNLSVLFVTVVFISIYKARCLSVRPSVHLSGWPAFASELNKTKHNAGARIWGP